MYRYPPISNSPLLGWQQLSAYITPGDYIGTVLDEAADRSAVVVMQGFEYDRIAAWHTANPGIKCLLYKEITSWDPSNSNVGSSRLQNHCLGFQETGWSEAWCLHQSGQPHTSGFRLLFSGAGQILDLSNATIQARVVSNLKTQVAADGWDGVFLDNCVWKLNSGAYADEAVANSQANWQTMMEGFLAATTVGAGNLQSAMLVAGNIGSGSDTAFYVRRKFWCQNWCTFAGFEEGFGRASASHSGSRDTSTSTTRFAQQMQILMDTEDAGAIFVANSPNDHPNTGDGTDMARYSLAMVLLGTLGTGLSLVSLSGSPDWNNGQHYAQIYTLAPDFDNARQLGAPVQARMGSIDGNGCYSRTYTKGLVLVNPTTSPHSITLPAGTYNGSGFVNLRGSVTIAATSGAVLIKVA